MTRAEYAWRHSCGYVALLGLYETPGECSACHTAGAWWSMSWTHLSGQFLSREEPRTA